MKATGLNILFEYFEVRQSEGGIALVQSNDAHQSGIVGKVLSVGSLVQYVKVGDSIIVPKLMRTPIDAQRGLYVTPENQVLAIIDG